MLETKKLVILAVSAIAAFAVLYWLLNASLVFSFGITAVYTALGLFGLYYQNK